MLSFPIPARVVYGIVWHLAEAVIHEMAWTVGIGCIVRLGIAYVMPVAAVTRRELRTRIAPVCPYTVATVVVHTYYLIDTKTC